jgi:hypothetical protein
MKLYKIFLMIYLVVSISSCKKQDFMNPTLVGKWKLTEVFSGYSNGGDFAWHHYPSYHEIIFKQNATFEESTISNNTTTTCNGSYSIQTPILLKINSSCQTIPIDFEITQQTSTTLIRDIHVIEGVIREKYIAIP